jgi:hypothetical protein
MAVIIFYKDSKNPDGKLKAIRTDCDTGIEREVELGWIVKANKDGKKYLHLIGGPSGYESAYVDDLEKDTERGWIANSLTKTCSSPETFEYGIRIPACYKPGYDGLFIPPAELERVLQESRRVG